MAIYYLRKLASVDGCGPGDRAKLLKTRGSLALTWDLDATGDTWNAIPHSLDASPFAAQRYAAGTWSAKLMLASGFLDAKVRAVLARYNSACVLQQTLHDSEQTITSTSFTLYTFASNADVVTFAANDILLLIVYETEGTATMEYDSPLAVVSRVETPAIVTVRPHEYYKRQRRRRAC